MFSNPEEAFGGTAQLLALIETIYAAVQQPELWDKVMEDILRAINGDGISLWSRMPQEQLFCMSGIDPSTWDAYAAYYASINELNASCDLIYADGETRYSQEALPDRVFERTEFYNDFFKPLNWHHTIGLKIPFQGMAPGILSTQRSKLKGEFTEREGRVYQTLLPHLQRAISLSGQFQQMRMQSAGLEHALDAFEHAVFGLDRDGRVVLSNRHAEALAVAGDGLSVTGNRLSCTLPEQRSQFDALITAAISTGALMGISTGGSMLLRRRHADTSLRITVSPFASGIPGSSRQLAALVFVNDPAAVLQTRAVILRSLYGFTPTEIRVADALLGGREIRTISEDFGLTLETTRFHTKRILAKTGTKRQSELIRLMLSLPAL